MSKPRNPRYFPRMKVRGARRRRLAPFQRLQGGFDHLSVVSESAARSMLRLALAWPVIER